jgi:hypothetical protein
MFDRRDLRHGRASYLLAGIVATRGEGDPGVSQISLTMNWFARVTGSALRDAADEIGRMPDMPAGAAVKK